MWTFSCTLSALFFSGCLTAVNSQVECGDEGDIQLVNGGTPLEGIVEICYKHGWGTICDNGWDNNDSSVVCRQLGFSAEGSQIYSDSEWSQLALPRLDEVSCGGREQRLSDCPANEVPNNCITLQDAGVQCQPNIPQQVRTTAADSSVVITWQSPGATPDHYNITLTHINNSHFSNQTQTTAIQVLGTTTRLEHGRLIPEQKYSYCVSAIYGSRVSPFCHTFQTQTESLSSTTSAAWSVVVGNMSVIIVLLVLLLAVAGTGLAYPRYIRSRIKNKKCLSRISHFLDEKIYLSNNSSYVPSPQPPVPPKKPAKPTTDRANTGDGDSALSYETVEFDPPPIPSRGTVAPPYDEIEHTVVHHNKEIRYEVPG